MEKVSVQEELLCSSVVVISSVLLQAADVLIDERTKAQMAGHIGCLLGGYKDRDVLEKAVQDRVGLATLMP